MPQDGDQVIVAGRLTLYPPRGNYQLSVISIEKSGVGLALLQLEELKKKLANEGIFDPAKKRNIPQFPRSVGVVAGLHSAGLKDIETNLRNRWPIAKIYVFPSLVQGNDAPKDIIRAITEAENSPIDVLIVGRGGGSLEDLWAFNEEIVVRAVAACPVPVISAVGHETDTTLCDFAADMRAPTPSAAAELAVPELAALRDTVGDLLHAVDQAAAHTLLEKDRALARLEQRLSAREPLSYVREMTLRTQHLKERLAAALDKRLTLLSGRLSQAQEHLRAVGPQAVLGRGYTIALRKGQAVASASQAGGDMTLIFRDGRANVRVQSVWEGDPFANEEGKANL